MICELRLSKGGGREAIVLPCSIVQTGEDNSRFVWTAQQGRARKRVIETGALADGGVTVARGLAPGDTVLVEGCQKVSEGTAITVVK